MSFYVQGILKSLLLEAQIGLLLFDRVLGDRFQAERKWAFRILAGLMVLAWCNFGNLRGNFELVHEWEQFHFYLGAKYQKEVGWFDLYKAAVLADRETLHAISSPTLRDIHTFELQPMEQAMVDGPRVRARFSDARWEEFKRDWVKMVTNRPIDFNRVVTDHGNSNSPAWAVIAHPIAELLPLTRASQTAIGWLDMALMGVMFFFIFRTFGERTGCIAILVWATPGIVFDYLAGSFLRWDWLFSLGMAVVLMKKERWATAGAFFGYAVATKLFPIFFGVALGIRALVTWQKERRLPRRYVRFGAGAAASGAALVLISAAMFGGFWCWKEYKERIDVARVEKFYAIQYSLQTVYLQLEGVPAQAERDLDAVRKLEQSRNLPPSSAVGVVLKSAFTTVFGPNEIIQARADVDIADHAGGFLLVKLLFTLLVIVLILRADDVQAFTLGPLLVYCWLIVNMYYWNMLGLLALGLSLRKDRPPFAGLVALHLPFILFYVYQHLNRGFAEGYTVALCLLGWVLLVSALEWRESKGLVRPLLGIAAPPVEKQAGA